MSEYTYVKGTKLKLKSKSGKKKHKKKRRNEDNEDGPAENQKQDTESYGGWWKIHSFEEIPTTIAIEMGNRTFMYALDNGLFTVGGPHKDQEGPSPEEIYTVMKISDSKVALKSGYNKFIGINSQGLMTGKSDAIAIREQWEPVFQEGKVALQSANDCFISTNDDGDVVAEKRTAGDDEMITLRTNRARAKKRKSNAPEEDEGDLKDCEVNYVKKFQSFQDRRLRVNEGDSSKLDEARQGGNLHEELLDRREKMKADRYCK